MKKKTKIFGGGHEVSARLRGDRVRFERAASNFPYFFLDASFTCSLSQLIDRHLIKIKLTTDGPPSDEGDRRASHTAR